MKTKTIFATAVLVACMAAAVWIASGSGGLGAGVLMVVGVAAATHFAVRWGGSRARENERHMQELISKKKPKDMDPDQTI